MDHAHVWILDRHGKGACGCGETRQFAPSWESVWNRRPTRDRMVVAREMAELHRQTHNIRPTSPVGSRRDSNIGYRL